MMHLLALVLATAQASEVETGGAVRTTARLGTAQCLSAPASCGWLSFNDAAVFAPWVTARPSELVHTKAALELRAHGPSQVSSLEDTQETARRQPWSVRVQDAWVATRGTHIDTQLGVQRVAWGVGQGISVVDTINPYDLENPTRFDQRLSTLSAVVTLHSGTLSLTAVGVPFFVPAALPQTDVSLMAGAQDVFEYDDVQVASLQTRVTTPESSLSNTAGAMQLRWSPSAVDLALSWSHGRDSIPQVDGDVLLVGYQTQSDRVDVGVPLTYPKLDVAGLTARGRLPGGFSGWAEVARVMPERTAAQASEAQLQSLVQLGTLDEVPQPIPQTVTQTGSPFTRWLVGMDREVGPVRLTAQWLHGFFTERSADALNHYGLAAVDLGLAPTVRVNLSVASDLDGWLCDTSVTWLVADALEWQVGLTHIQGADTSAFGGLQSASNARIQALMAF